MFLVLNLFPYTESVLCNFFWFLFPLSQPSGYPWLLVTIKSEPLEGHRERVELSGWWPSLTTGGAMTMSISGLSLG